LPAETLRRAVNDALPADIHVLAVDSVPHRFHARHGAVARSYLYQIARRRTAFAKQFVWWVKEPLDLTRMKDAASRFTGMHDYQAFSDDDPEEKSTDVLVDDVMIGEDGDLILVRVGGSHFIWKMVRRMVGVLVEVGKGQIEPDEVWTVEQPAALTAPAAGLFLERVFYDGDQRQFPLRPAIPVGPARG
jgi:tRNA pseudouridine38-40 synthase